MIRQVSRGSAGEYQADEGAGIPRGHKELDTTEQLTLSLFRLAKYRKSGKGRRGDHVDLHSHLGEFWHSWLCGIYL